jgi:hypothetical protein
MDSIVKQTRAQQKQDVAQLPATVVRNIAEIERSYFLACGPMSDRLMTEVADALRKGCCQSDANSSPHDAFRSLRPRFSWRAIATPPGRRSVAV